MPSTPCASSWRRRDDCTTEADLRRRCSNVVALNAMSIMLYQLSYAPVRRSIRDSRKGQPVRRLRGAYRKRVAA
jgi:hypothetical protein